MHASTFVTGAGGFIGHHLLHRLAKMQVNVVGVDLKVSEFCTECRDRSKKRIPFRLVDLRKSVNVSELFSDYSKISNIYHLAADMGGIGYISKDRAKIATNNIRIDSNMLASAIAFNVKHLFFSSSACVYNTDLQQHTHGTKSLTEQDAWPAKPEEGYGLEKLFMEKLCEYYRQEYGVYTTVARFHNVYGPNGTFQGGAEKAPAALCRKVALAKDGDEIEVWGDGKAARSFLYVDDCITGILKLMRLCHPSPVNLGSEEQVSIDQLAQMIIKISGKRLRIRHVSGPEGVRGRNSDNTLLESLLKWQPAISLQRGLEKTYSWIKSQV